MQNEAPRGLNEVPIARVYNDFYHTDFPLNGASQLSVSCPGHDDRTPSLRIYYDDNTAYCFAENVLITPTAVIQRARKCSYQEADRIGREFYRLGPPTLVDEREYYAAQLRKRYVAAAHEALLSCPQALDALTKRGVTGDDVTTYRIGYHALDFDALSREQLETLGITDSFKDTIILPWLLHGSCVGLEAWDYRHVTHVKYRIPSGSFKFLLGETDPAQKTTLLVEGYFNLISCNRAGYAALCTLGKYPSEEAVRYLQNMPAHSLVILFDVGAEAEAYELAKRLGPAARLGDLKVIRGQYGCPTDLSEGFDPNDLYQKVGEADFKAALDNVVANAVSVFDQWLSQVRAEPFGNRLERSLALAEGQELIARLPPEHRALYREAVVEIAQQWGFSRKAFDDQFGVILRKIKAHERDGARDGNYFNGTAFVPKRLADELLAEYRFLTLRDTEDIYYYEPAEGIYKPGGEQVIQAQAQERLGQKTRTYYVNEATAYIRRAHFVDRERVDCKFDLLPVENGVLNVRTGAFAAYNSDLYFLSKLPVTYDETATCPRIEAALSEVVAPQDLLLLQEVMGYSLVRQYIYHKAIMLLGSGENGKSLCLNLLGALLGSQNVATRSLQDLIYNRFATADLYQKFANICADIPSTALKQTGIFKMLTGEDLITAERKHRDPFVFRNYAKLFFSANELPATLEQTHAFFRRWIIVRFPYRFVNNPKTENEKQQDPELLKKLSTPEELSGLLNWALKGVRRILKNGGFSNSTASDEVKALWIQRTDSLQAFLNTRVKVAAGLYLSKAELNKAYRQYCEEFEVAAVDPSVVGRRLPALLPTTSAKPLLDGKQVPSWKDVALVTPDADEPSNREGLDEDVQNSELQKKTQAGLDYEHKQQASMALDGGGDAIELPSLVAVDSHTIRVGDESNAVSLTLQDIVAVDLETTGLDPATDHIMLGSVVDGDNTISFADCEPLAALWSDPTITKVFHNATFDVAFLEAAGFAVRNYEDTRLMAQVLTNNTDTYTLQSLAHDYLGIELEKSLQAPDNWQGLLTDAHIAYNVQDATVTLQLYHVLKEKLQERGLELVYERERNALPVLRHLASNGMHLDATAWQRDLARCKQEQVQLVDAIRTELQTPPDFNLNSPTQILAVLANRGIDLPDTREKTFKQNIPNYPILAKFVEYKRLGSLITKSGTKLLERLGPDGRLHPEFQLVGTITGRMASSKPNLQQIDSRLKPYFKPAQHHKYVIADYSQIQLRILAALSRDPRMAEIYDRGEDLHTETARAILHKAEITSEDRKLAKAINFGMVFGSSAKGLQTSIASEYGIELSPHEAEQFRNAFFTEYAGVQRWHDGQIQATVVESPGGRKWWNLPKPGGANSKWRGRINYPIQAAEAEGVKEALILLLPELEHHSEWKLVNAVHDELVLEVPDNDVEHARETLVSCMKTGMRKIIAAVPIEVEAVVADCWAK